jgi:hypothetical protein
MKLKQILTTAIVGTALAVPSTSSAQAPTQDSVTTSQPGFPFAVSLDASSGPLGENPTGVAYWHAGGGLGPTWRGDVSCLSVSGNAAIIGFGDSYFGPTVPGLIWWIAGLIRVVDNGPGLADTFEWVELQTGEPGRTFPPPGDPLPGPADCSSFPTGGQILSFPLFENDPFTPGDIVVTDAQPPLPTSKDQCKNGGWLNFPQFKNQGQCIAFVNQGP